MCAREGYLFAGWADKPMGGHATAQVRVRRRETRYRSWSCAPRDIAILPVRVS